MMSLLELQITAKELNNALKLAENAGRWQEIREKLAKIESEIQTWGTESGKHYRIM